MGFDNAIKVDSIREEYQYIGEQKCNCGGQWQRLGQALLFNEEKPFDRIDVECNKCKSKRDYWFDVSSFFGKPQW